MLACDILANHYYQDPTGLLFVHTVETALPSYIKVIYNRWDYSLNIWGVTDYFILPHPQGVWTWKELPPSCTFVAPHPRYLPGPVGNAMPYIHQTISITPAKCECGAAACRSPMHSSYCPLYLKVGG